MGLRKKQIKTLIKKNFTYKKKDKKKFFMELYSFFFVTFMLIFELRLMPKMSKKEEKSNNPQQINLTEAKDINLGFSKNGNIGYVVSNNNFNVINIVMSNNLFKDSNTIFTQFQSENEMEEYYLNNKNSLIAGIVFDSDIMSYSIRIDGSSIPDPSVSKKDVNSLLVNDNTTNYLSVFSPLQMVIDEAIIQLKTGDSSINLSTEIGKLPQIYKEEKTVVAKFDYVIIFMTSLFFIIPLQHVVQLIVSEKERKIKSFLMVIGMHPSSFWISWFLSNAIYLFTITVLMSIILSIFRVFSIGVVLMFIIANCLYSISLINFTLLFTTFFSNPKTAYSISKIMFVLFTLTYIVFNWGSMLVKYIAGIFFSPVSYGIIVEKIIFYEKSSTFSFLGFFKDKVVLISLIILIWDILFYFVLALIFDYYFSDESESFLSWKKGFRSKRRAYEGSHSSPYINDIEEYHGYNPNKLDIRNVSKKFKDYGKKFLALNDVSFKAYENEIFCILGHKGAGKTTLLKILTGLISPDDGLIIYEDSKFYKNKQEIREKMGVCNQENILFDLLTVEENINVFSGLKSVKDNLQELLTKIDLWKKKDMQVKSLSGGEKRKLCIGIALLGNPRYVFLDEPTTGLDPVSRRHVWKLLSSIKKNKFIIMTTHYMNEADILSDRKLILSNGIVRCLGTSVFLKNHFELMYHLNIKTANPNSAQRIILNYVPDAVFDQTCLNKPQPQYNEDSSLNELIYTWKLPIQSTPLFKDLFKALNSRANHHIIRKYGIKSPSLEELFMKLTENEATEEREINNKRDDKLLDQGNNGTLLSRTSRSYPKLPDPSSRHTVGSFKKLIRLIQLRFKIYFRNYMFILYSILVPILLSVILFIVLKFVSNRDLIKFKKNEISVDNMYPNERWNFDTQGSNLPDSFYTKYLDEKNIEYNKVWSFNNYTYTTLKNRSFFTSVTGVANYENYTFFVYYNETKLHGVPTIINHDSNLLLKYKGINSKISVKTHPFPYYNLLDGHMIINGVGMSIGVILVISIIKYGALVVKERNELIVKQLRLNGVSNKIYWFSVLFTDFIFFIVMGVLVFGVAILCKYQPFLNIYVIPIMAVTLVICTIGTLLFQYCLSFLFDSATTAYSYLPTINLVFVMIGYFTNSIISIINVDKGLFAMYSNSSIITQAILTLIYPPYSIIAVINFISWRNTLHNIDPKLYLLTLENYISFDHGIPIILIAATISMFIYLIILIVLNIKFNRKKFKYRGISSNIITSNERYLATQDQNVYDEYMLVKTRASTLPISTINLHKSFKNKSKENLEGQYKTVLDNLTFHVDPKECFGLLGPNGAGKSTTINILTNSLNPDYGNVCYEGYSLKDLAQLQLGYCSQEDILWKELTIREHLVFYLELRGYSKREIKDVASKYISYCDLEKHQNKKVKNLSGATKRKLSLLIAICGYPKYIILDEPTLGMDPYTRRFVWGIIRDIKNRHQSSILLTTHSMEEAEALCDRLAILINGRIQCIGSPDYLTMTYANQFILDLETDRPNEVHEDIFQNHNSLFSKVEYHMEKETDTKYKYYIEKKYQVGRLFELLEKAKKEKKVKDYVVTESSLDDVFLDFVKEHRG